MTDETSLSRDVSSKIVEISAGFLKILKFTLTGLTSSNLGEQCRSIAEFPDFIKTHPFPIVINSVFLKIADLFLNG